MTTDPWHDYYTKADPWHDYYTKADNLRGRPKRAEFWGSVIHHTNAEWVLEVGCGNGLNLEHLISVTRLCIGIDAYMPALDMARDRCGPQVHLRLATAEHLKLPDQVVDLAFTCTTLQHISDDAQCDAAIAELIRVSRKWVLVMEYDAAVRTPVRWRENDEGIVKRPWGDILKKHRVEIVASGFLPYDEDGFDDVTWYLGLRP